MKRFLLAIFCLGFLFLPAGSALRAEDSSSIELCRKRVETELSKEQRLYRSVLFGHGKAQDAHPGEVRFDKNHNAWIKTRENAWKSASEGFENLQWSDSQMDGGDELPVRRGIFETKRVLTSDLVPFLTQSFRALQCRTELICRTTELSIDQEGVNEIPVRVPGCIEETREPFHECDFVKSGEEKTKLEQGDSLGYCRLVGYQLLDREEDLLKLAAEYDAAYRSILELSGMFDSFLQEFRWPIVNSLKRTVELVGQFQRIPCFSASCDLSPEP